MLGSDVIREVSLDLNDQEPGYEYARWPYEQLRSYMQEAMNLVAVSLHDLFLEHVVVELEPGDVWQEACTCTKITKILGECTSKGRILKRLRRMSDDETYTWAGKKMSCPGSDTLDSYMLSSTEDNSFRVASPISVSDKRKHYVLVECYEEPNVSEPGYTPPDEAVMIVKQWMLFRAQSVDSENNTAIIQLAGAHRDEFHRLLELAIQRRALEEMRNGGVRPVSDSSSQ